MSGISIGVCILLVIIAALVGFGGCYLWMLSRERKSAADHERELSAKAEELARAQHERDAAVEQKDAEVAERERVVGERDAKIQELEGDVERLEGELEVAQVTQELDQFSDFQLLGMCDVYDAEVSEECGALRRPMGDPAMEQLMNLDIVTFEVPHDAAGRDKTPYWNLKPMWRRFTKLRRAEMDERTEALRTRRDLKRGR